MLLFQDLTQDPMLHLLVCLVQPVSVPHSFLVFHNLDSVEGYWPALLQNVPQRLWCVCALLIASYQGVHSVTCTPSDVNLECLAKPVSARTSHCKLTIFPFTITKNLGGGNQNILKRRLTNRVIHKSLRKSQEIIMPAFIRQLQKQKLFYLDMRI